jgi:hypothetical protein
MIQLDTTGQLFAIRYPSGLAGRDEGYTNDKVLVKQTLQKINVNFENQDFVPEEKRRVAEDTRWRIFSYNGDYESIRDKDRGIQSTRNGKFVTEGREYILLGEEEDQYES